MEQSTETRSGHESVGWCWQNRIWHKRAAVEARSVLPWGGKESNIRVDFGVWCSRQMRAVVVEGKHDRAAVAMDGIPEMVVARSRVVVRKSLRELRKGWGDVWGKRVLLLRQERWATSAVMEITNVAKLTAAPHFRPQPRPHPAKPRLLTVLCHHPRHLQGAQATRRCVPGQLPCWELSKLQPPAPCPATKRQPKAANPQPSAQTIEPRSRHQARPLDLQTPPSISTRLRIGTRPFGPHRRDGAQIRLPSKLPARPVPPSPRVPLTGFRLTMLPPRRPSSRPRAASTRSSTPSRPSPTPAPPSASSRKTASCSPPSAR